MTPLHSVVAPGNSSFPELMISVFEFSSDKQPVHAADVGKWNKLGTFSRTSTGIGTVAESKFVHLRNHRTGTAGSLGTSLRQQGERTYAGTDEQHGGTVLASSHTGTTTDAGGSIHALFRIVMRNEDVVGVLGRTCTDGNKSAGLKDLVERRTVYDEVLDHRKSRTSPRLHRNGSTVFEMTHKQLAGSYMIVRTMGTAVDVKGAGTADTLATVVVKRDRTATLASFLDRNGIDTFPDQLLIENIEHLEERGILFNARDVISLEMSLALGVLLTPYLKIEFHLA